MAQDELMLTPTQAAQRLGLSANRLRQMSRSLDLPCTITPLGRLFPASAIDALAQLRAGMSRPVGAIAEVHEAGTTSQMAQEVPAGPRGTRTGAGRHAGHGASNPDVEI
jgi:hypothetical protein